MDISPLQARLVTVDDLRSFRFLVPKFQRFYAWRLPQWTALFEDLYSTSADKKSLFLGLLVVVRDGDVYQVIDGQQRLTSLGLLLSAMNDPQARRTSPDGHVEGLVVPQAPDDLWFTKLLSDEPTGDPARQSQRLMSEAYKYFESVATRLSLEHVHSAQMIIYCASEMSGATSLFERVNLRGIRISNIELVKNRLFDWTSRIDLASLKSSVETDLKN